jgi:murein L,D-transpeptidase YafK
MALPASAGSFLDQQRTFPRFRTAEKEKATIAAALFESKGLQIDKCRIFLRVLKYDKQLQLWARNSDSAAYVLVRTYPICASSGDLGPKRVQGDGQVPEGCYIINRFNPTSNFYMSLGLNYPNASDRALGGPGNLGGDIFIHGDCVTIGCVPITDPFIKELYLICAYARDGGQKEIPVHVFPTQMDEKGMAWLSREYPDTSLARFWANLRPVYRAFERSRELPKVRVSTDGWYQVE